MSKRAYLAMLLLLAAGSAPKAAAQEEPLCRLSWAVSFGSSGYEWRTDVVSAVDGEGNLFVGGLPNDIDFTAVGPYAADFAGAYSLTKFAPSGEVLWSRSINPDPERFSTSGRMRIGCDSQGNVYLAGAVLLDVESWPGGVIYKTDIFLAKVAPEGEVLWSVQFGGQDFATEYVKDVAVTPEGEVLVTGETFDTSFPTTFGLYGGSVGGCDGFVAAFSTDGVLLWSTCLGGTLDEEVCAAALTSTGDLVVIGRTCSADFPVVHAYQNHLRGASDFFVSKFSGSYSGGAVPGELAWSTYLGGSGDEMALGASTRNRKNIMTIDGSDNVIFSFRSPSDDFPATIGPSKAGVFVLKLSSDGDLLWSRCDGGIPDSVTHANVVTCLGDNDRIYVAGNAVVSLLDPDGEILASCELTENEEFDNAAWDMMPDGQGGVMLVGRAWGDDLPAQEGSQPTRGGADDAFMAQIDEACSLVWASYLGGSLYDVAAWIERFGRTAFYLVGETRSEDLFEQMGPPEHSGDYFAALVLAPPPSISPASLPQATVGLPYSVQLTAHNVMTTCSWSIASGELPLGLSLHPSEGLISGTPVAAGLATFVVQAVDDTCSVMNATRGFQIPVFHDEVGPSMTGIVAVPAVVRESLDLSVTVIATADDTPSGSSNVAEVEYFVGAAGAPGTGTPVAAADGTFDSPVEAVSLVLDTSAWTAPGEVSVSLRARDILGNWGAVGRVDIPVVDAVPPAAADDLALVQDFVWEKVYGEPWSAGGMPGDEELLKEIDLGDSVTVGGISLSTGAAASLFPSDFEIRASEDGENWTRLVAESGYRPVGGTSLWYVEIAPYRYIKMTAEPVFNPSDGLYYVDIGEIAVYETSEENFVTATWTATADDGNDPSSPPASAYDLRHAFGPITESNFASFRRVEDVPSPSSCGSCESCTFSVGESPGTLYAALKIADDGALWSPISNVPSIEIAPRGFAMEWPENGLFVGADSIASFGARCNSAIVRTRICFSDRPDFPLRPVRNSDGTISRTLRIAWRQNVGWFKPGLPQWRAIKRLAAGTGTVYWRLEGASAECGRVHGPTRALNFRVGSIFGTGVSSSHQSGFEEAVWPDASAPPEFYWTNATEGMKYFYVDVSSDETMATRAPGAKLTIQVPAGASSVALNRARWRSTRRMASKSGGELFWRVRALDRDKACGCASVTAKLIIDGGEWTVSSLDLSSEAPEVSWTHTGDGITQYRLQVSVNADFSGTARETLTIPSTPVKETSYTFKAQGVSRLGALARRNGAGTLYYRVRGEDAERAFVTYSQGQQTAAP